MASMTDLAVITTRSYCEGSSATDEPAFIDEGFFRWMEFQLPLVFAYMPSYCADAHLAIEEYLASSLSASLLI
jgi:hypothetical protein